MNPAHPTYFRQLAEQRYSVRRYAPRAVEPEKVRRLVEMIQLSPTSVNLQPQHLFVIQSEEAIEKLRRCTPYSYGAPLAFLMCYDKRKCWYHPMTGKPSGDLDASIALTHIMMEATDLGLGSLWVNGYDPAELRKQFPIPDYYEDTAILFVGYPREDSHPAKLHTQTKKLEEMMTVF